MSKIDLYGIVHISNMRSFIYSNRMLNVGLLVYKNI